MPTDAMGPAASASSRRRTSAIALVLAPVFWLILYMIAMASQTVFFAMEDYLQSPMWTEQLPAAIGIPLRLVAMGASLWTVACVVLALMGVVLIVTPFQERPLRKAAFWLCAVITAAVLLYETLLAFGYFHVHQHFPAAFGAVLGLVLGMVLLLVGGSVLVWRSTKGVRSHEPPSVA